LTFNESSLTSDESNLLSDESSSTFKKFNLAFNEQDITNQIVICEFGQISEESMLRNDKTINEYLSNNSECSDNDEINSAEFPSIAYQNFIEI
ncbi:8417_t:CDS:1, partial [Cetraspora pellucida]